MSLLGIDVGTTGCKAVAFSLDGDALSSGYREYSQRTAPRGHSELESTRVWVDIRATIAEAAAGCGSDPVQAISISSLGESVVPVTKDRKILGASILMDDPRGAEYIPGLAEKIGDDELYRINGNTLGNHYGITKLMWVRDNEPRLYENTDYFLNWAGFVAFMLGADATVDYSLANRSLLFDIDREDWSETLLTVTGLDGGKLPDAVPSGTLIGEVSRTVAADLGLPAGVALVAGAHDQCANSLGCGATAEGTALYGMGTYLCLAPTYKKRKDPASMCALGLNTEHHSMPGRFTSFIYNQGGSMVKWFRDSVVFGGDSDAAVEGAYAMLDGEMPTGPSGVLVLPHFSVTGPPDFLSDSSGLIAGLTLSTTRGDLFKGVLEGATYYLLETLEKLPSVGIAVESLRAAGGGSNSDAWVQLTSDIMNVPVQKSSVAQAGSLGAAIMAGTASGAFASMEEGAQAMVHMEREFIPDSARNSRYRERYEKYREIYPRFGDFLREIG